MNDDRHARVRQRAYDLWERAGQPDGCDQEHWLLAEAAIAAEESAPAPKPRSRKPRAEATAAKPAPAARKPRRTKSSESAA